MDNRLRGRGRGRLVTQFSSSSSSRTTPSLETPKPSGSCDSPQTTSVETPTASESSCTPQTVSLTTPTPSGSSYTPQTSSLSQTSASADNARLGFGRGRSESGRHVTRAEAIARASSTSSDAISSLSKLSLASDSDSVQTNRMLCEDVIKSVAPETTYKELRPSSPVRATGSSGTKIDVRTNCVRLNYRKSGGIHQYFVNITPDVDNPQRRSKIVKMAFTQTRGIRCFDGGSTLYLPEKTTDLTKHVSLDDTSYVATIKLTRILTIDQCVPLFGTLIRNCCKELGYTLFGRKFFNMKDPKDIPQHRIRLWAGYVTSVEEKEGGVFLTLDTTSRVMQTETGLSILKRLQSAPDFKSAAEKEIIESSFVSLYNNRLYRIEDILWTGSPAGTKFKLRDGNEISVKDYFYKQYGLELSDDKQPLFVSKIRDKGPLKDMLVYLVPELCSKTGITDRMRKDYQVMKQLSSYLKQSPIERQLGVEKMITSFRENEATLKMLNEWGLEIAENSEVVKARILPPFAVHFGRNQIVEGTQDWKRNIQRNSPFRAVDIRNWVIFNLARDANRADDFLKMMRDVCGSLQIQISAPKRCTLNNDRVVTVTEALEYNTNSETQAIVFIMSSQRVDIYAAIKKFSICVRPMALQAVLSHTLSKPDRMRPIIVNIALQIVAKMGGALWKVPTPLKKTMVCGIDTYHDKGGKNSVAGFVASIDPEFTSYLSKVVIQTPKIDLMLGTYRCTMGALTTFQEHNGTLPDRIIVYRDGVSTGDFEIVLREVEYLRKACRDFNESYNPSVLFVLCVKRINLRYYTAGGRPENVPPGTVLDSTVTLRDYPDFLIVSQTASQGTLTPTHYVVLVNDTNLDMDRIQRVTYHMCHIYYNWAGTVRVPAPCIYAHKLADMVGQYVQKYPHPDMEKKPYYL